MFIISGLLTLSFHAALIGICSTNYENYNDNEDGNKSLTVNYRADAVNGVSLHTGLVLASISTLSLLFVNCFFLIYLIPKNPFVCGIVHVDPESGNIRRGRRRSSTNSVLSSGIDRTNSFEVRKARKLVQLERKKSMESKFKYLSRRDKRTRFGRHAKAGPAEMCARFRQNFGPLIFPIVTVLVPCAFAQILRFGICCYASFR